MTDRRTDGRTDGGHSIVPLFAPQMAGDNFAPQMAGDNNGTISIIEANLGYTTEFRANKVTLRVKLAHNIQLKVKLYP